MHCLLTMRDLEPDLLTAWKAIFEHVVFDADAARLDHIPPQRRGALGRQTPQEIRLLKDALIAQLQK
jgi:hypothetical protein